MHITAYLFHPSRPPDMFAVYHPTRPPDPLPPGVTVQASMADHPPGPRLSCAVPALSNRPSSTPRTLTSTILFGERRLPGAATRQANSPIVASTRHPGARSRNTRTRSSDAESSTPRIRRSAQQYSCSFLRFFSSSGSSRLIFSRTVSSSILGSPPLSASDYFNISCVPGLAQDCDSCYTNARSSCLRVLPSSGSSSRFTGL
ncbi:hypothetical protein L226DRAFT_357780 [Lentinus tigrinus ALCF2SS1-7]|uniref:uncharacterized protein n=1 Tax=Lentinus tigrinus ALCF2SS1-7 TaxID=1328758 RepID=UPI001165EB8C|nr:hypothetical protein L226DRAFT_357780 [Lentinus tigrinus ALCF2SS1-7]